MAQSFNLVTDPWLRVVDRTTNLTQTVSLDEFFRHAQDYRQLAGDMRVQDLAILRFLLAILTTVYSRLDADDQPYDWLTIDQATSEVRATDEDAFDTEALWETWEQLSHAGHFSASVTRYLQQHLDRFDLFGAQPFYQVTVAEYDAVVPTKKRVATGTGQVAIKQINRRISESANSPALFAPKTADTKNDIELADLARWLITYQNFTGVTDKTKIETTEKFSNPAGWTYRLNPVFAQGDSLFESLLLNLVLVGPTVSDEVVQQRPVWEYPSLQAYVEERKKQLLPDNLAALYTDWSRLLHLEWDGQGHVQIFSAGLPMYSVEGALIEPMTTWRWDKKITTFRPAAQSLRSLGKAMWRNFGQYVKVTQSDQDHEPDLVRWLQDLKDRGLIPRTQPLNLVSVALISDGNATSQSPAVEVADDLRLQAAVLLDTDPTFQRQWPVRIEDTIQLTQTIGTDYYHFATDVAQIRNLDKRLFASGLSAKFYERLNGPFKAWLAGLSGDDDRDQKINDWKQTLQTLVYRSLDDVLQNTTPRDVTGIETDHGLLNIFTASNRLRINVSQHLDAPKGGTTGHESGN